MKWLPKLMGFDYEIMYKSGSENKRANALSRMQGGAELAQIGVTTLTSDLYEEIKQGWTNDQELKGKLVINNDEELWKKIPFHFYNRNNGGHSGSVPDRWEFHGK
ncbi:hypothetical protein Tco_1333556 [Tanacetum coccineum]